DKPYEDMNEAHLVSPGRHKLMCGTARFPTKAVELFTIEGQRNRVVVVDVAPTEDNSKAEPEAEAPKPEEHAEPQPQPQKSHSQTLSYVLAGLGVVALGTTALVGAKGVSDAHHLQDTCKPNCNEDEVSAARSKIVFANISFGIGVVALTGAVVS